LAVVSSSDAKAAFLRFTGDIDGSAEQDKGAREGICENTKMLVNLLKTLY
jgi:hypothetical protein